MGKYIERYRQCHKKAVEDKPFTNGQDYGGNKKEHFKNFFKGEFLCEVAVLDATTDWISKPLFSAIDKSSNDTHINKPDNTYTTTDSNFLDYNNVDIETGRCKINNYDYQDKTWENWEFGGYETDNVTPSCQRPNPNISGIELFNLDCRQNFNKGYEFGGQAVYAQDSQLIFENSCVPIKENPTEEEQGDLFCKQDYGTGWEYASDETGAFCRPMDSTVLINGNYVKKEYANQKKRYTKYRNDTEKANELNDNINKGINSNFFK